MVEFNPISASKVSSTSGVSSTTETGKTSGSNNIKMVDDNSKPQEQVKAENALKNDIKNGNATYIQTNPIGDLIGLLADKKAGNYVDISNIPPGTTLGDIRKQYNLPPGSLRHLVSSGGGDFDSYKVPTDSNGNGYVYIYADDLAEGIGVSNKELKGMFPDKQFSPWYSWGTKE